MRLHSASALLLPAPNSYPHNPLLRLLSSGRSLVDAKLGVRAYHVSSRMRPHSCRAESVDFDGKSGNLVPVTGDLALITFSAHVKPRSLIFAHALARCMKRVVLGRAVNGEREEGRGSLSRRWKCHGAAERKYWLSLSRCPALAGVCAFPL